MQTQSQPPKAGAWKPRASAKPFVPPPATKPAHVIASKPATAPAAAGPLSALIRIALTEALMPDGGGVGGGLPIPPLIELIAQYLTLIALRVRTVSGSRRGVRDGVVGVSLLANPISAVLWDPHSTGVNGWSGTRVAASDLSASTVLLFTDSSNSRLRTLNLTTFETKTIAGGDITLQPAEPQYAIPEDRALAMVTGLAVDPNDGSILVVEPAMNRIRRLRIYPRSRVIEVSLVAGAPFGGYNDNVIGTEAGFNLPRGIVCAPDGSYCYVADSANRRIRRVDLRDPQHRVQCIAGTYRKTQDDIDGWALTSASMLPPISVALDSGSGELYHGGEAANTILYFTTPRNVRRLNLRTGELSTIHLRDPLTDCAGVTFVPPHYLLVSSALAIYYINLKNHERVLLAGAGTHGATDGVVDGEAPADATFHDPHGLVFIPERFARPLADGKPATDQLIVCDSSSHRIRLINGSIHGCL